MYSVLKPCCFGKNFDCKNSDFFKTNHYRNNNLYQLKNQDGCLLNIFKNNDRHHFLLTNQFLKYEE